MATIESFSTTPFQNIIQSYLYQQYADDSDLQAFVNSYNSLTQSYLDWYNQNPLSVYTNANISGSLLDWIGVGLYGISRPYIVVTATASLAPNTYASLSPYASRSPYAIGTLARSTQLVSDDVYKRFLTWNLFIGDEIQPSILWLRKRVARFIYGINGNDYSFDDLLNVSITQQTTPTIELVITVPNITMGQTFKNLFDLGILPVPFQVNYSVTLV